MAIFDPKTWFAHGITMAGTVIVTMITVSAQQGANDVEQSRVLFDRISALEDRIDKLRDDVRQLSVENTELKAENTALTVKIGILQGQVDYGDGSNSETIFELLESLQVPAWCKAWVGKKPDSPAHFEMAYINSRYEVSYNVSKAFYIGSTDFDVHPVHIAQAFTENDLRTFSARGWLDFRESVRTPSGEAEERRFWKFYHKVKDGPELVCGWEVP
jgi:hypothetical protein